ncbi:LuxR family transcriptional regulator [Nocardioides nanhaiensis]|uniref:LuxR family transcriptional regulator n=1 Tax=Nocardioides nanhaiensis TaxID=1476871 RepID=A0ABP8VTY2_9ACTN
MHSVGRASEIAVVVEALDRVQRGEGGLVWLEGEPGIGKSHLLAEAAARARGRGIAVHAGSARELEAHRPFAVVTDCLAGLDGTRQAAQLLRTGAGAEAAAPNHPLDGAVEYRVAELLFEAVAEAAEAAPVLLALDDLQWADPSSLQLLARSWEQLTRRSVVIVAATRPTRPPALARLVADSVAAGAAHLPLGPLDEAETARLVAHELGAPPGAPLAALVERCGGNPLLVATLVRALRAEGSLADHAAPGHALAPDASPVWLRPVVVSWLSHLDEPVQLVLSAASILGSSFTLTDLAVTTGRGAQELWPRVREALTAGVLRVEGAEQESLAFAHDVVREVLYEDLPAGVRRALHAEAAEALHAAGAPLERVGEHLLRGARPGDPRAIAWLGELAEQTAPRAPGIAVELWEAVLRLMTDHDPRRAAVQARLALAMVACGQVGAAEELARTVLEDAPHAELEGTLRLCLADALMRQGRVPEVVEQARATAALTHLSAYDRARAEAWLLVEFLVTRDLTALRPAVESSLATAQAAGHVGAQVHGLTMRALVTAAHGLFVESTADAERAARLALQADTAWAHEPAPLVNRALGLVASDQLAEADRAIEAARRTYERLGMWPALAMVPQYAALVHQAAGRWEECLQACAEALDLADRSGLGWRVDMLAEAGLLHVRRGHLDAAADHLRRAGELRAQGSPSHWLASVDQLDALLAEARGEPAAALATLGAAWRRVREAPSLTELPRLATDLLRLLRLTGAGSHDDAAAALLQEVAHELARLATANPGVESLRALALLAAGVTADDVDAVLEASEVDHPKHHLRAHALEEAALALARASRRDEALRTAASALELFDRLGADGEAHRLRARLAAAGVSVPGGRRQRSRPATGWDALTASELRVAELVGRGLSNPEIAAELVVSRHTVATHVAHTLAKLGMRSRVELAAALAARRPPS